MNKLSKILLPVIGLGVIGFAGLKIAEIKAEEVLRADFERMAQETREKDKIEFSFGEIEVDLLKRLVTVNDLKAVPDDEEIEIVVNVKEGVVSGFNIIDLFESPEAFNADLIAVNNVSMSGKVKNKEKEANPFELSVERLEIIDSNLGELNPEFEDIDKLDTKQSIALLKKVKAGKISSENILFEHKDLQMKVSAFNVEEIFSATMKGFSIKGVGFSTEGRKIASLSEMFYKGDAFVEDIASKAVMQINGMSFKLPEERQNDALAMTLRSAGMDEINLNFQTEYDWDLEKRILDYKNISLDLKDAVKVKLTGKIADTPSIEKLREIQEASFNLKEGDDVPPVFLEMAQQLSLLDLSLSVEDKSLIDTFLKMEAKKKNTSKARLSMGFGLVAQKTLEGFISPDLAGEIGTNLQAIMQNGGEFNLAIKTKENKPIKIMESLPMAMLMPQELFNQFNITTSHTGVAH